MSNWRFQLTDEERRDVKVLYLAPFAPDLGAGKPDFHPEVGVRAVYHYEIFKSLESLGLAVDTCRDLDELPERAREANFIFSLFSRAPFRNCEIYVPSVCERLRVPYLGAPPNIRALAEDKVLAKLLASSLGLRVAPSLACVRSEDIPAQAPFEGPYFVKYRFGSASEKIDLDCVQQDWTAAVAIARGFLDGGKECLIERLIPGIDVTVPVLGAARPVALQPWAEISDLPYGIATFKQKRFLTSDRRRVPIRERKVAESAMADAATLAAACQPFDYMRVDFRWAPGDNSLTFLEFNIACNLGSTAAIMASAAAIGLSQTACVEHILAHSLRRQSNFGRPWETENI